MKSSALYMIVLWLINKMFNNIFKGKQDALKVHNSIDKYDGGSLYIETI